MKTKMIRVAFVAAIAMVSGINFFKAQNFMNLSKTALANVEALAAIENLAGGEGDFDMCEIYPDYASTGKEQGKLQEYTHLENGHDRLTIWSYEKCTATGSGTLKGFNGIISKMVEDIVEVECKGYCRRNL